MFSKMSTNRIRTIARNAPDRVYCQVYRNGVPVYWYWGFCR